MKTLLHSLLFTIASNAAVWAAPVDLTPPQNVLGYADESGYFRIIQRFGEIKFSDGFELPLRYEFWTGRAPGAPKSAFGWGQWHCGPLESTAEVYGDKKQYLKATLLCAKTLFMEKSNTEPNTYYTANGAWKGVFDGEVLSIARKDGWDLRFTGGKVSSLKTDSGLLITWHWGKDGKLDAISEDKAKDKMPLQVVWNEDRTAVRQLLLPHQSVDFAHDSSTPPANLMKVSLTAKGETRTMSLRHFAAALEITEFDGVIRRFDWMLPERHLVSDGLNQYKIHQAKGEAATVEMINATGKTLSRQSGNGTTVATDLTGTTHRIHRIAAHSAAHRFISHVERLVGDKYVLAVQNSYDNEGRLLERKWLGSPFLHQSYSDGKVEESLTPEREVTFHSEPVTDLETFSTIKFAYDAQGKHTGTTVDGKPALSILYDDKSRILLYQVGSRFTRQYEYHPDGSTLEKLIIPGFTDRKFGYLTASDPSITETLVIEKFLDSKGRLTKKEQLDQTFHTYTYDENDRFRSAVVTAADRKTIVSETSFVYQPQTRSALMIEKDHMDGETRYHELTFEPNGNFKKGRRITAFAAEKIQF